MADNSVMSLFNSNLSFFYILIILAFFLFYLVADFMVLIISNSFLKPKAKIIKILKGALILSLLSSVCYPIALFVQNRYETYKPVYEPSYLPFILTFAVITVITAILTVKYIYGKLLKTYHYIILSAILFVLTNTTCLLTIYGGISL